MGTINTTTLLTLLDSIASGKLIYDNAVGTDNTVANTTAKAAANDTNTVAAIADPQVLDDLIPTFKLRSDTLSAPSLYGTLGAYNIWWALDRHLGGLDTFMRDNNLRASVHVKEVGFPLSAEQIMPPVTDPMATFVVTGGSAGTYTHVADIDTSMYGRAWLDVTTTAAIGGTPITATLTGLQWDMSTIVVKQVTINAGSSSGTTVHVGTLGTQGDSFDAITDISITGGTAGDAFKVVSRAERVISATS